MMLNEKARQTQDRGSTNGRRSLLRARRANRCADYSVNCHHRIPVFEGSMKDVWSMNSGSYHSAGPTTCASDLAAGGVERGSNTG